MCFSVNCKMLASGLMIACLALSLVGCSPEASTATTKPPATSTGAPKATKAPKEQAGSTVGESSEKGREAPEPSAADPVAGSADEKPASDKPNE